MILDSRVKNPKVISKFKNMEEEFRKVHGDLYDYSEVVYINNKTNVNIICKKHGSFSQSVLSHKNGTGCPKCSIIRRKKFKSQEQVIKEFRKVHGDLYDYSEVVYTNGLSEVDIICKKHGIFKQKPAAHKAGKGCLACYRERQKQLKPEKQVIEEFRKVHGDLYDYSKMVYKGSDKKIDIICKKHGIYKKIASVHKLGQGCPKCSREKTNYEKYKDRPTILYYVKINNLWKIGICLVDKRFKTTENNILKGRFAKNKDLNIEIESYKIYNDGWNAYLKEQEILNEYDGYRYIYESKDMNWFVGHTELFKKDIRKLKCNN